MGSFFRSEEMSLCRILMHSENAFDCMVALGHLCTVQFNQHDEGEYTATMSYMHEVHRCSELLREIKQLQTEIDECGLSTVYFPDVDKDEMPRASDLNNIEFIVEKMVGELNEVLAHRDTLQKQQLLLQEKLYVLSRAEDFFTGMQYREAIMAWSGSVIMQLIRDETRGGERDFQPRLGFLTGSIPVNKYQSFETILWRMSYGNIFIRKADIPEVVMDIKRPKVFGRKYAFVVFFLGEVMRDKILKLCQAFSVNLFDYPESATERIEHRRRIHNEREQIAIILQQIEEQQRRILTEATLQVFVWRAKVRKMLQIYTELNKMGTIRQLDNQKYLLVECWIPTRNLRKVRRALLRGAFRFSRDTLNFPPLLTERRYKTRDREPPTSFNVNKFTRGFQNLINAYGIASYKELNPAPYTIVTFPFLFAVMFGDIGHGIIMLLFGLWMWRREKKIQTKLQRTENPNEIFTLLFAGRYVILFMGIFSIYTGLLYNVCFSRAVNILGSHWRVDYKKEDVEKNHYLQLNPQDPKLYLGTPYIFGVDPVWGASGENSITTYNSLKMKMAIILGVTQMLFGQILSAVNYNYFKNPVDLYLVFVPQIVFLSSLFLYLAILIIVKWCTFGGHYDIPYNNACAPSILITFINMMLFKENPKEIDPNCEEEMFPAQHVLQTVLIILALLSVPVLLLGKPITIMREQKKIKKIKDIERQRKAKHENIDKLRRTLTYSYNLGYRSFEESQFLLELEQKEMEMSEVWIHQGIHCIESVLGAVSHTASYLRLWALSLAHEQLSTVLWQMVLAVGLQLDYGVGNSLILVCSFSAWAVLTVAILVVMEGLSAFLHTLRLHWVEFQSKFYSGAGEPFTPFCFEQTTRAD